MAVVVKRLDVYLVNLDATLGREIQKTRPCVIISPDEINCYIKTVIIAPMTGKSKDYPTRIVCQFQGTQGQIVLDQIRTVDKKCLVKHLGRLDKATGLKALETLQEMFAP